MIQVAQLVSGPIHCVFFAYWQAYFIMSPALKKNEVNRVLEQADRMNEEVANEDPRSICKYQNKARAFLKSLELYANRLQLDLNIKKF